MNLENKVAVVTGGAMGNGLGIVKVFLKYGANVVILDYSDKLADTLKELNNPKVSGYKVDIRDKRMVDAVINDVLAKKGKIDILINNAGAVVPNMIKNHYGKIVNLSSVTGPIVADAGEVAYATTKAALLGFTKALAMELVKDGINVNAIMPGYIMTPMVEGIAKDTDASNPDSVVKGIADGIPMGRLGTIEELGELAAFLASDNSSYITGQGIVIDGASTLPETRSVGV